MRLRATRLTAIASAVRRSPLPPPASLFAVLSSLGTSYAISNPVLSSAGAPYTVPSAVLSSAGVSYNPR